MASFFVSSAARLAAWTRRVWVRNEGTSLPWATMPGAGMLVMYTSELTCHTWDLAVATGQTPTFTHAAAAARDSRERELGEARLTAGRLTALMEKLTDAVHRDEVLRAQNRLRLEQLTEKVLAEHGLGMADLVAEYGPDEPVPASDAETAEYEAAKERGFAPDEPQSGCDRAADRLRRLGGSGGIGRRAGPAGAVTLGGDDA